MTANKTQAVSFHGCAFYVVAGGLYAGGEEECRGCMWVWTGVCMRTRVEGILCGSRLVS